MTPANYNNLNELDSNYYLLSLLWQTVVGVIIIKAKKANHFRLNHIALVGVLSAGGSWPHGFVFPNHNKSRIAFLDQMMKRFGGS